MGRALPRALIDTVAEVLKHVEEATVKEQSEIRLLHVLTGDGVPTNLAAARFLLGHFQRLTALGGTKFVYFLIPHVCASHQANLAVSMAITICSPDSPDVLPANCSRLFKYLIPLRGFFVAAVPFRVAEHCACWLQDDRERLRETRCSCRRGSG